MSSTEGAPARDRRRDELGSQLVAATAALWQRYTDRSDLVIGYVSGDTAPRPLALDLAGDPTFSELVARVNSALDDDSAHNGFEPDAFVALDREPPAERSHPWLSAHRKPEGLDLTLHSNGSSPAPGTDGLFVGHLRTLLAGAEADPEKPIAGLPVLTDSERHRLLIEWNDTAAPYPCACMHELVEEQARATPDMVAVQFGDEQLTYAELDARANQLAHHLTAMGVSRDVLVGICVERSLEMVVGLLGIVKAGGAYVPIDPDYPAERQEYMLTNSQAPVVLTQERLRAEVPSGEAEVVCLDGDWPAIARLPTDPPAVDHDPEQLAYVIYTSGSTGKPKGVQIPHRALVNFLITMGQTPGLTKDDVLVAVTTLSFDIAGLELYLPLITGARVIVASAHEAGDPRALAALLDRHDATVMQATPTTWRMLLDSGWPGRPAMKALCGGEALPQALADRLVEHGLELWNMYGPTETTIWSTCARIRGGEPLTIGRPIANTTLYILDPMMQPTPVGVAGELWIGGDGLARGYRGRPDLTEERFVPHPFDETPGARIYRTGDLARYRPDGTIGFLGRIDHQVKVRGFRIELGEIETVLARHPGIKEAVVVARGSDAEAELHAYVLAREAPVPAHDLRQYLSGTLPAYMVPSTVTTLEAFPLTPNGKVDRKALPEPTRERSGERELIAPRTPLEQRLAAIWERELGISPIGVTDNFFDLGVTSIVAATLFAAIEHELGAELPLGAIFRAPTIESLAVLLEGAGEASRWTSLVPIQLEGTRPPIFCVHGGAGTILHLAALSRRLGSDQPFYGLQSRGLYGGASPLTSVEEMATHYLAEMRQVQPHGPWYLGGYCFGAIVAHEIACRLEAEGEEVRLLVIFNGPSPAWIKRWGWHGNQPGWLARHPRPPRPSKRERRRDQLVFFRRRLLSAAREPRRFWSGLLWYFRKPRTRLALALGRPIPEELREMYFLELHQKAERAYAAGRFSGEILTFYGEGLYEDPALGWEGHAAGGIRAYAVPGEHNGNRDAMMEPAVEFVAERLGAYLDELQAAAA